MTILCQYINRQGHPVGTATFLLRVSAHAWFRSCGVAKDEIHKGEMDRDGWVIWVYREAYPTI